MDPATWLLLVAFLIPMGEVENYLGQMFSITKVVMLVVVCCSLAYKVAHGQAFYRSALDVPILLLVASFVFSLAISEDSQGTATVGATVAGYFVLNMVVCNFVVSGRKIRRIMISLVVATTAASALGVMQFVTGQTFLGGIIGKDSLYQTSQSMVLLGTAKNPNAFGGHFAVAIPITLALLLFVRNRAVKLVLLVLIVLFSINLVLTLARGAMLGAMAGVGVMLVLLVRRNRRLAVGLLVAMVCVSTSLGVWWKYHPEYSPGALFGSGSVYAIRDKADSIGGRVALAKAELGLFLDHPLLGVGYGTSSNRVQEYGYPASNMPHNIFLGIACELGLVGLIPFAWITMIVIRRTIEALRQTQDPVMYKMLLGLLGAFVAQHSIGMTHANYVSISLWLTTSLLIAGSEIIKRQGMAFV